MLRQTVTIFQTSYFTTTSMSRQVVFETFLRPTPMPWFIVL